MQGINRGRIAAIVLPAMLTLGVSLPVDAADPYKLEFGGRDKASELSLPIGRSQIINSPEVLDQVVIGNPAVADIKLLSSRQVLILGNKPGHTNLVFRDKDRALIAVIDVVVGYDLDGVKRKLYEAVPNERNVEVRGINDSVILSGEVSSLMAMDSVVSIASSFVPKDKVINNLQVGGGQQVMLEAKVAEVSRTSLKEFGFDIDAAKPIASGGRSYGIETGALATGGTFPPLTPFGRLNFGDSIMKGAFSSVDVTLRILETKGLAKTLAEPNIVALSGHEASFLAGGEVPIPTAQSGGVVTSGAGVTTSSAITVTYKEFGVGLKFTPTVLTSNKINLKLNAEVSALDFANSINFGVGNIPSITTRRTATTVEMGDGQSFAIAGLMQADMNNAISQLPGLGNLPVLGALFRSSKFQRNETELVVVVTPRLVKPVNGEKLKLPTDNLVPPSDVDMYLLGRLEGRVSKKPAKKASDIEPSREKSAANNGGVDGAYGHKL
jgi:pilus assembly protein CpaC